MRYLTKNEVVRVVGGTAVTGWVPASEAAAPGYLHIGSTIATRPVRIPGLIPGPIFNPPGAVASHATGMWEC